MPSNAMPSNAMPADLMPAKPVRTDDEPGGHGPVYQVTLADRTVERVEGADAYQQEGPMTTFFRTAAGRQVVDTWSTRVASFRTADIVIIRRLAGAAAGPRPAPDGRSLRSA